MHDPILHALRPQAETELCKVSYKGRGRREADGRGYCGRGAGHPVPYISGAAGFPLSRESRPLYALIHNETGVEKREGHPFGESRPTGGPMQITALLTIVYRAANNRPPELSSTAADRLLRRQTPGRGGSRRIPALQVGEDAPGHQGGGCPPTLSQLDGGFVLAVAGAQGARHPALRLAEPDGVSCKAALWRRTPNPRRLICAERAQPTAPCAVAPAPFTIALCRRTATEANGNPTPS